MEIRRAGARASSREPGIVGHHCFSWGAHYDPDNISFGPLVAANLFELDPGSGFDMHPHAGVDIVTWVIEGELTHRDSGGAVVRLSAASAAVLRTGAGLEHSERNEGATPTRFVQLFLHPGQDGPPMYRPVPGRGPHPVCGGATVQVTAQPPFGVQEPAATAGSWCLVLAGSATVDCAALETGDELRARPGCRRIEAGAQGAELILFSLD